MVRSLGADSSCGWKFGAQGLVVEMSVTTTDVEFQLYPRCVTFARGVPTLAQNFSGPLCSFAVRTAEVLPFLGNTATGGVFTFLGLGHLVLLGRDVGAQSCDAIGACVVESDSQSVQLVARGDVGRGEECRQDAD
jgi:hypothetical protein